MSTEMRGFFERIERIGGAQALVGKPASLFASAPTLGGGTESAMHSAVALLAHLGMVLVPMGFDNLRSVTTHRAPKCLLLCIDVSWSMLFGKVDMEYFSKMHFSKMHFSKILQIFGGLVLGCIKTKFCKKICVRQHFSSSTRFASFCTAAISKFSQKIGLKNQQFS